MKKHWTTFISTPDKQWDLETEKKGHRTLSELLFSRSLLLNRRRSKDGTEDQKG